MPGAWGVVGVLPGGGMWGGSVEEHPAYPHGVSHCYQVDDMAAALARVREAGGTAGEPDERHYGTLAECVDDQGTNFQLWQPPAGDATVEPEPLAAAADPVGKQGDVGHWTFVVPDDEAAKAFYGHVLGWEFEPGGVANGWQLVGVTPGGGIWGGGDYATGVTNCYQVDDAAAAVARVRAAGGTAEEPVERPYGTAAECVDNQGIQFQVWQPPADAPS